MPTAYTRQLYTQGHRIYPKTYALRVGVERLAIGGPGQDDALQLVAGQGELLQAGQAAVAAVRTGHGHGQAAVGLATGHGRGQAAGGTVAVARAATGPGSGRERICVGSLPNTEYTGPSNL